jgi:chloride channel 7
MCLTKRVRLREVWDTLHYSCHNAFPVVSYDTSINHNQPAYQQRMGRFLGIVLRDDLITMLSNAWFEDSMMHADELCWEMLQENYPRFGSTSQLFFRDSVKDNSFLNLDKIIDSGHIIPAGSTYKDAFERFRRDWVRHLVVVDEHHEVAGIITRKDLYRYVKENYPHFALVLRNWTSVYNFVIGFK